jgi:hypothetical protein
MLRQTSTLTRNDRLEEVRQQGAAASADVEASSKLRKVSLARLEKKAAALQAAGEPLPADMRYLAGLQTVRFVLFFPESSEVVLAGPAEGWQPTSSGELVGKRSQHPVLHLEDLLAALRFAYGQNQGDAFLGCSIEPTDEGLRNFSTAFRKIGQIDPTRAPAIFAGLEQATGPQDVKLYGAPGSSRLARVMVAADYRLKRLAMGHDPSPVKKVVSYLDLAAARRPSGTQPQPRWWFVGNFAAISHTSDRLAFEFEGEGLKVETGPSLANFQQPAEAPKPTRTATQFAQALTQHFEELAARIPVFAELQNIVGLAVAATLIRQHWEREEGDDDPGRVTKAWRPTHFLDVKACPVGEYRVPTQTPSLASYRRLPGKQWLISVSGGVEISPETLIESALKKTSLPDGLNQTRRDAALPANAEVWWWD